MNPLVTCTTLMLLALTISACNTHYTNPTKSMHISYYSEWRDAHIITTLEECDKDSWTLTRAIQRASVEHVDEDVLHKWLMESCVKHFKLDI